MSTKRIAPLPASPKERGPNGRRLCRRCHQEVPKGRSYWCGHACVYEHRIRSDPAFLRAEVWQRDHGVCARCGADTEEFVRAFKELQQERRRTWPLQEVGISQQEYSEALRPWEADYGRQEAALRTAAHAAGKAVDPVRSPWEADHILPVVEGGGETGLENIRTLCLPCHRQVTTELQQRLALAKRRLKDAAKLARWVNGEGIPAKTGRLGPLFAVGRTAS